MRAGRLQTRRIKVRRRYTRIFCGVVVLALLAAGVYYARRAGLITLSLTPSPTLSPTETQAGEATMSLPGETWYALQLGVYSTADAAKEQAAAYANRGAAAYVLADGTSYRVLAAAYDARAKAQQVATRLKESHGIDTYLYDMVRGDLSVKCKGQNAQLQALSDAYANLSGTARQLYTLSCGLDDYSMALQDVQAALKSQIDTANALAARLNTLFTDPPASVRPVMTQLTTLQTTLSDASAQTSAALMGAKVKYAMLQTLDLLSAYVSSLSGQPV